MIINSAKYSCAAGHEINEDSYLCSAEKGIFIVADGLGGHSDGEKASLAAVDYFKANYRGGCNDELILQLIEGANTEVLQKGDGGKTTVAAAFAENGYFRYANAGDSRVYYFRDGRIIAQTKDHSVCQASVDMGMIRPEDIRGNEDRSRLLKVLGSEEKVNIKKAYPPIKIQNGDAFLICSDGFWEYVYETEMEADLLKSDNSEAWLKYMLKRHILRAENKGDNYTAVCGIFYFDGSEPFPKTAAPIVTGGVDKKKLIPFAAAGTALIAAAIILSVLLRGGGNEVETILDITDPSSVSTTTETEAEATEKTTKAAEAEIVDLPEHIHVRNDNWQSDDDQHWKICPDCGEEYEKSDHIWDDGVVEKKPTETEDGAQTYTCTVCSAVKTEAIAPPDHTHTYSNAWTNNATHHWHAADCGHADEKDKAEHIWNSGSVTKEPTETAEGERIYICTVCSAAKTESIPQLNHTHTYANTWASDNTHHWHASTCGHADEIKDKAKHSWDSGKVTKEPTETADGVRTYTCAVCSATKTETIARLDHTHTYANTWTSDDTHHWHAADCGHADEMKDKAEHSWDSGTVTKAASCAETGIKTYKCTVCGHEKTETIPVTAHKFVDGKCGECGEADPNYTAGGSGNNGGGSSGSSSGGSSGSSGGGNGGSGDRPNYGVDIPNYGGGSSSNGGDGFQNEGAGK